MTTPSVPNDKANRPIDLYHSGQLRGSSGSLGAKSTSYRGSEVYAVPRVVILETVRARDWDCERRDVWVAVRVSARSSWSESDDEGDRSAEEPE